MYAQICNFETALKEDQEAKKLMHQLDFSFCDNLTFVENNPNNQQLFTNQRYF